MELRSTYPEQYNPSCFQFAFPAITGITTDKDGLMLEDMLMRVAGGNVALGREGSRPAGGGSTCIRLYYLQPGTVSCL